MILFGFFKLFHIAQPESSTDPDAKGVGLCFVTQGTFNRYGKTSGLGL